MSSVKKRGAPLLFFKIQINCMAYLGAKFKGHAASRHDDDAPFDDDPVNNNRSRPLLPDRPVRPVGARQPLNWNVSPKSPEGRTPYERATGIKPNETKRSETKG